MLRQSCKRLVGTKAKLSWCRGFQVNTRDLPIARDLPPTFSPGFHGDDPDVGTGYASCRHTIKLQIKVDPNTRKIVHLSYFPSGCPSLIACSSALASSELLKGKGLDEAVQLNKLDIEKRHKCLACEEKKKDCVFGCPGIYWTSLVEIAIKAAVRDYQRKHHGSSTSYFTC